VVGIRSLKSNMVKLEWQNALYKTTHGSCKIIPVRVDGCQMPAVLLQTLYIDMFSVGIEATIVQIVSVIQGNATYTPQHLGFSNLTYRTSGDPGKSIEITISASHLMEPNPDFAILVTNAASEVVAELANGQPTKGGFNPNVTLDDGRVFNAIAIAPLGGAITPQRSLILKLTALGSTPIGFVDLLHLNSSNRYEAIPRLSYINRLVSISD
jgi:hypothetical protein